MEGTEALGRVTVSKKTDDVSEPKKTQAQRLLEFEVMMPLSHRLSLYPVTALPLSHIIDTVQICRTTGQTLLIKQSYIVWVFFVLFPSTYRKKSVLLRSPTPSLCVRLSMVCVCVCVCVCVGGVMSSSFFSPLWIFSLVLLRLFVW